MEHRVELQELTSVKKRLQVEIPAEFAASEFNRIARDYQKHARLPGFRPGKAPLPLVKRRYDKDIRGDLLQKLIPESCRQALRERGVQPLGEPDLEKFDFEEGKPLSYEALFEVRPEIKLPEYQSLEISLEETAVTDEDVDAELEKLRLRNAHLLAVEDRPVSDGDFATIDLKGEYLVEGEHPHAHGTIDRESVEVHVGDESTHEAFSRALRGMNIGEEKTFEVDYPEDYPEKKLAGHRVRFSVEVTDIKRRELPELTDEFARDLGEYETLDQLRKKLEQELKAAREKARESELRNRALERLIELCEFEVPQVLVEDRINDKLRDLAYNIASRGVDPSRANINWQKVREDLRSSAEKDVRGGLILDQVAEAEKIEVTQADLDAEIDRMVESMQQPLEKVRQFFQKEGRTEGLKIQIGRHRAMDRIMKGIQVRSSGV